MRHKKETLQAMIASQGCAQIRCEDCPLFRFKGGMPCGIKKVGDMVEFAQEALVELELEEMLKGKI